MEVGRATYDDVYRTYYGRLVTFAARRFGDSNADDIAQEAMLRAYRAFDTLDPARPVWPWLATIAYNTGVDLARANRHTVPTEHAAIDAVAPVLPDLPLGSAVAGDDRRRLGRAMRALTQRDRVALNLYEVDGRPVAEIATMLGTTANTVRQRLFRARRHLAAEYEAAGGQPAIGAGLGQAVAEWLRPVHQFGDALRGLASVPAQIQEGAGVAASLALALVLGGTTASTAAAPAVAPPAAAVASTDTGRLVPVAAGPVLGEVARAVDRLAGRQSVDPAARKLLDVDWSDDCVATRALRGCTGTDVPDEALDTTAISETIYSSDGTALDAEVLLPAERAPGDRHPVVLVVGPYVVPGVRGYPELWDRGGLFGAGYAYVQVALRGRGRSGGCPDFGGPGERADVRAAVEWAADQPWSTGRVGMWGTSYDGWAAVMALAERPRGLAAAVVGSPVVDFRATLDSDGVRRASAAWPQRHLADAAANRPGQRPCLVDTVDPPESFWAERDLRSAVAGSGVPVLWSHGFADPHAPSRPSLEAFAALTGPKRAFFGHFAHGFFQDDAAQDRWFTEARDWLDRFVADRPRDVTFGAAVEARSARTGVESWRDEPAWPAPDAVRFDVGLLPGSYRDLPGNCADVGCTGLVLSDCEEVRGQVAQCGNGSWSFSQPLPYAVHLTGAVDVTLRHASGSRGPAVVILHDIDADGWAAPLARGAAAGGGDLVVSLHPGDFRLPAGHRLGVLVAAADTDWYVPAHSGTEIVLDAVSASLTFLPADRRGTLAEADDRGAQPIELPHTVDVDARTVRIPLPPPGP